jgi:hypothetical protein
MKEITKDQARELLLNHCRRAVHIEGSKIILNKVPVEWTYLESTGVVLAKGKDGKYYSDVPLNGRTDEV